jgi:hypothetical protein
MKTKAEQIQLILEQENGRMESLLKNIENGNLSRKHLEGHIKEHIKMNLIMQKISKELKQ